MRIFLAGALGVIGRRLTPLLARMGHHVTGTTRSPAKAEQIEALSADPVVVDVFDAEALRAAVSAARPEVVMHQLTDLPRAPGTPGYEDALKGNARLRIAGTRNLMAAAQAAGAKRVIAQSIAFVYAPGEGPRAESDPLDTDAEGIRALTEGLTPCLGFPGGFLCGERRLGASRDQCALFLGQRGVEM